MKDILLVGDDKIGRKMLSRVADLDHVVCFVDQSGGFRRTVKLILKGSLSLSVVAKMVWAELTRADFTISNIASIKSNEELLAVLKQLDSRHLYLFRAGLIVNQRVLNSGVEVLNIHCASLEGFGGLGSIARALASGSFNQCATLHRVTERIDQGEVLQVEPYQLNPTKSYQCNEDIAYASGMLLLERRLKQITMADNEL